MKFIYALNEDDRQELITKGFKELFSCYIGEKKAYAFDDTIYNIFVNLGLNACYHLSDEREYELPIGIY